MKMETRYFNNIAFDKKKNSIKKTSLYKLDLINEINWYIKIPKEFNLYHPIVYNYSLCKENPYIELEFSTGITLSECFVNMEIDINVWKNHLNKISNILNKFRSFKKVENKIDSEIDLHEMYIDKTFRRLNELRKQSEFRHFFSGDIIINGASYRSIDYYLANLVEIINQVGMYENIEISIIHGDPCFTNILLEQGSELKLIDPRGNFGKYDIYGDYRYDWAKISQCIYGKYDFIVNDLFELQTKTNSFNYKIHLNKRTEEVEKIFADILKENNILIKQIRLIESLLFLSMVSLHKDHLLRQKIMLCKGIELLDQVSKDCKI